jgi:PPOX class probable F420-dependent enzyme
MTDQTSQTDADGDPPDGGVLNERVRQALTSGRLAHLVTLGPGGDPQVTLVWVGIENNEIVAAHLGAWQKVKNIRRDPRVVLSLETGERNENGLDEYLVVYGRARVTEGGAADLLQKLAWVYIGPDVRFPPMDSPPPGYITRITPERVAGVGPWSG